MDRYRVWSQQLFRCALQLSDLTPEEMGQVLAVIRERDSSFRHVAVEDWERGETEASLANFLALCRLTGVDPCKVIARVEEDRRTQALVDDGWAPDQQARTRGEPSLRVEHGGAGRELEPTAADSGRRRRGPRLYVITGGLVAIVAALLALATHSLDPLVWAQVVERTFVHSQGTTVHQVYVEATPTPAPPLLLPSREPTAAPAAAPPATSPPVGSSGQPTSEAPPAVSSGSSGTSGGTSTVNQPSSASVSVNATVNQPSGSVSVNTSVNQPGGLPINGSAGATTGPSGASIHASASVGSTTTSVAVATPTVRVVVPPP